ncbi:hypothetical protein EDM80_04030 [bacterium]|nr:MAG: hypothetical protein EDM80_04030 [bacterium]RIK63532.1 MAG: hypothetical protein DCC64_06720 [Planctomycetota bacterium]
MLVRRRRRSESHPTFDMTPMIDCVFQLLIFFIVCTHFRPEELVMESNLSTKDGLTGAPPVMREQVTLYCEWDAAAGQGQFVVALGSRGRRVVENSRVALSDLLPRSGRDAGVAASREPYRRVFGAVKEAVERSIMQSGAVIEKIEVSFAGSAREGASGQTAPWAFVVLGIDVVHAVNKDRKKARMPEYEMTFKFMDALGRLPRRP